MIKKFAILIIGLLFFTALPFPAFADQSIGYQYYFHNGVKALKEHHEKKALYYFKIAQIFDPNDKDLKKYLNILTHFKPQASSALVVQAIAASQPVTSIAQPYSPPVQPQPPAPIPKPAVYITTLAPKHPPLEISLAQIFNSVHARPTLQIELNSSVILEGKNIQRFLLVDEGFIGVRALGTDNLQLDALRIGTTFLHIWDDRGRHTLYVEVVFS